MVLGVGPAEVAYEQVVRSRVADGPDGRGSVCGGRWSVRAAELGDPGRRQPVVVEPLPGATMGQLCDGWVAGCSLLDGALHRREAWMHVDEPVSEQDENRLDVGGSAARTARNSRGDAGACGPATTVSSTSSSTAALPPTVL